MTTFVGCFEATIYCPRSFSLKDKRSSVKGVIDRVTNKLNVAGAEVDFQNHQRKARVAFSVVGSEKVQLEQMFEQIEDELFNKRELDVREISSTIF